MKALSPKLVAVLGAATLFAGSAAAQYSSPPPTPAEIEAVYNTAIENRTAAILKELALNDPAKEARVHDVIIAQYRNG